MENLTELEWSAGEFCESMDVTAVHLWTDVLVGMVID